MKKAQRSDLPRSTRTRRLESPVVEFVVALVAAFALTLIAYGPGLDGAFVSDDVNAIVENEWVSGPFDPAGIVRNLSWWGTGRSDSSGYRPAATLSFAANLLATGPSPYGFRIVNFACNALCAALLFSLARMLGLSRAGSSLAGAAFTLLPIHSEAVVWIVGRAELAAAAAFLLIAILNGHYRRSGADWALPAAAATIVAGIAFKENAVTALALPAIFFLTGARDRVFVRRDVAFSVALAAGTAAYAVLRATAIGPSRLAAPLSLLDNPLSVVDAGTRLLGAVAVLGRYVALTFWPSSLSIDYSYDALGIGPGFRANADTAVALLFVAVSAWMALRVRGRREIVIFGLLVFAASYSIVSNTVFLLGTILGERLFYLPTAGLVLALAAASDPMAAAILSDRRKTMLAGAALVVVASAMIHVDRNRAADWRTPVAVFESAVAAVPGSARAHMELATAYGGAGRVDEASRHFAAALAIKPDYSAAAYNQGNTLARAGRYDDAVAAYRKALSIDPRFGRAWHNLGLTERLRGNAQGWLEALRQAVELSPSPTLRSELGEALLATGKSAEALSVYDSLLASGSAGAAIRFNRGVAQHHIGGCAAAVGDYSQAAAAPDAPRAAFAAAAGCLRQLGRKEEAQAIEQRAKVANRDTRR